MKMLAVEMTRDAYKLYMKNEKTKSHRELIQHLNKTGCYLGEVVEIYIID